jgi:hypothetical protein
MKIGFYPGCSLSGTAREYNESVKAVAKAFQIELVEIKDWNCCGASAAHNIDHVLALSLPARILALAEEQGLNEILVPCAACYNRLSSTQHHLSEDEQLKKKVVDTIEMNSFNFLKSILLIKSIIILPENFQKKLPVTMAVYSSDQIKSLILTGKKILFQWIRSWNNLAQTLCNGYLKQNVAVPDYLFPELQQWQGFQEKYLKMLF